jgi:PTH1 family peptidyl-tRNA hydrolase
MFIVIGLGNPGDKYKNTRHNAGFMAIDDFQKESCFSDWKNSENFKSQISEGSIGNEKIVLAKPQTFMNLSGQAAAALVNFYKIDPKNIIVIHDELALPLGTIRVSQDSSAGGHNGVSSIIESLGTQDFIRIRLGISPPPLNKGGLGRILNNIFHLPAEKFVLKNFSSAEKQELSKAIKKSTEALKVIMTEGVQAAMNRFN